MGCVAVEGRVEAERLNETLRCVRVSCFEVDAGPGAIVAFSDAGDGVPVATKDRLAVANRDSAAKRLGVEVDDSIDDVSVVIASDASE